MYDSIRPGQIWLDTKGERIQAHGGSVMYLDGLYYWYGENKEKTTGKTASGTGECGATARRICIIGRIRG